MPRTVFYLAGDSYPEDRPIELGVRAALEGESTRFVGHWELHHAAPKDQAVPIPARLDMLAEAIHQIDRDHEICLIGRSSGARTATLFAHHNPRVTAVACFCYPFRTPHRWLEPERFAHLATLTTPTLLIQGAGDLYGGIELTENYQLSAAIRLRFIPGGHEHYPDQPSGRYIAGQMRDFIAGDWRNTAENLASFDEDFYRTAHPGIADAIAKGTCSSGKQHFEAAGRQEGRRYRMRVEVVG
jgi:predicted alpha/beta-hydrolase family hydrolase